MTKPSKKTLVKEWVEALESGEYKQTNGALHNADGYCCLGVLCDVFAKHKMGKWTNKEGPAYQTFTYKGDSDGGFLPTAVADMMDRTSTGRDREDRAFAPDLSSLNDSGTHFKEIAKIIRNQEGIN